MSNGPGAAKILLRQAKGMALFSACCLAFALLYYAIYRSSLYDRPNDPVLLMGCIVPMTAAIAGFLRAGLYFHRARRSAGAGRPEP